MTDDYRIYVDANWPATLNDGAGVLTDFHALQEAVSAWRRLAPEQKIRATVSQRRETPNNSEKQWNCIVI